MSVSETAALMTLSVGNRCRVTLTGLGQNGARAAMIEAIVNLEVSEGGFGNSTMITGEKRMK